MITLQLGTLTPPTIGPVRAIAMCDFIFCCVLNRYSNSENLQIWAELIIDQLLRLLFIYELVSERKRELLPPTSDYDSVAIRGDKVVLWSMSSDELTSISTWDSTSKTLKHFRSQ